jgi:hypothetical protein
LKDWAPAFETLPYPPATGQFAVYAIDDLLDGIDYTMRRYNLTQIVPIGSYDYDRMDGTMPPAFICITKFREGTMWPHNQSYAFDAEVVQECFEVTPIKYFNTTMNSTAEKYDIRQFFKEQNRTINFDRLNKLEIKFALKTVHLKTDGGNVLAEADCFQFNVTILYDNSKHNGQVLVTLNTDLLMLDCLGTTIVHGPSATLKILKRMLDIIVILVSSLSFVLCLRTLYRSHKLNIQAVRFFKLKFNKKLSLFEQSAFLNLWDVLILINDGLTVFGTITKILIESKNSENYEFAGMLLGIGNLLVWLGVLRYLYFFEHYNILILTMKQAIPDICRFLVCAAVLYLGFAFCGWIVLGPYHLKFGSLAQSSECLFALVNGDEIFVTYSDVRATNAAIYWFSRIYLYLFISLFTYVVYSLFTSIIITTYETIKFYYREGFPKSELQMFMDEIPVDDNSPMFMADDREDGSGCSFFSLPCFQWFDCFKRSSYNELNESTRLVK